MVAVSARAIGAIFLLGASAAQADPLEEARGQRWVELRRAIFGDRTVVPASEGEIVLDMPDRALDGARVPVAIRLREAGRVRSLTLVVDENPMPLAARVIFGLAGDPQSLALQVRVDRYTYVHAVTETQDGTLHETARFVKAAGGCSGPPPAGEAVVPIGHMSLKLGTEPARDVALTISHPNCTGMQIDPVTRGYTPARYIESVDVTHDGANVLRLETGISLAADPTIGFRLASPAKGELGVVTRDSDATVFEQTFDLDRQGS